MAVQRAFRVTLSYSERSFKVDSAARIEKIAPASEAIEGAERQSGSWFALEDAKGRTLYRRHVVDPRREQREVFTGEEREMRRTRVAAPSGILPILVPDMEGAEALVLYASDTDEAGTEAPARPVFKVSMRDIAVMAAKQGGGHGR